MSGVNKRARVRSPQAPAGRASGNTSTGSHCGITATDRWPGTWTVAGVDGADAGCERPCYDLRWDWQVSPERWQQAERLYHSAMEKEPAQRAAYLALACQNDEELRSFVDSLLEPGESTASLRNRLVLEPAAQLLDARLEPGARLGPYEILRSLGAGGMGEVYEARDTRLGRVVALKVLPPGRVADPERRRRFAREARAASMLNHPNIVTIHDIAQAEGVHFIVMEYVSGTTLSQLIPMDVDSALRYASGIAAALAMAHAAGITHRDIKPANIMVTGDGTVKVLDFGIAKLDEPPAGPLETTQDLVTYSGQVIGTPAYMSPEQADGRPVDARSDIYSLGLLLFEMLSGFRPFENEHPTEAVRLKEPRPLCDMVPHVTPDIDRIILRCLRRDPSRRFQTMIDVRLALDGVLASRPSIPSRPSIAVLPFVNMSSEKDSEYFSDGLAEEIINTLTRASNLKVTARTSAFSFRGKDVPIEEIARKLRVQHVIEGSVRRAGNRIRVTAQLIKAEDGFPLWSERFDRDMTDVFAIQDEIAGAIVKQLKGTLSGETARTKGGRHVPNLEAYNAYLKGRYHLYKYTPADFARAKECFESSIALDPDFALGYGSLALYHFLMMGTGAAAVKQYLATVEPLLRKTLELDPALSEAHALAGLNLALFQYDWRGAEWEFQQALASDSTTAEVYYYYAIHFLGPQQRVEEARRALETARQLNPLVPAFALSVGGAYACNGEFDRALAACQEALELDGNFFPAQWCRGAILLEMGNVAEALAIYDSLDKTVAREYGFVVAGRVACLARAGREAEARAILIDLMEARRSRPVAPFTLGAIHWALDDRDKAFEFLEEAVEDRDPRVLSFVRAREFSLASKPDPRHHALLRKMNLEP